MLEESLQKIIQPQDLTDEDQRILAREFSVLLQTGKRVEIFKALHDYFSTQNFDRNIIKKYFDTYWRWYVEAAWYKIEGLDGEIFITILHYHLPTLFMLDMPVEDKIFNYLIRHNITPDQLKDYYKGLREKVINSSFPINSTIENSPSIKDVMKSYVDRKGKTDIEMADFYSSIQLQLYPEGREIYPVDKDKKMENTLAFLFLLEFFYKDSDIWEAMATYTDGLLYGADLRQIDPDIIYGDTLFGQMFKDPKEGGLPPEEGAGDYTLEELGETAAKIAGMLNKVETGNPPDAELEGWEEEDTEVAVIPGKSESTPPPKKSAKQKLPQKKTPPPPKPKPEVQEKKISLPEIKAMIEQRFAKDASGQIENIEGVLQLLGQLAEENKDEKIKELYYFDEEAGEFKWNEGLLK